MSLGSYWSIFQVYTKNCHILDDLKNRKNHKFLAVFSPFDPQEPEKVTGFFPFSNISGDAALQKLFAKIKFGCRTRPSKSKFSFWALFRPCFSSAALLWLSAASYGQNNGSIVSGIKSVYVVAAYAISLPCVVFQLFKKMASDPLEQPKMGSNR